MDTELKTNPINKKTNTPLKCYLCHSIYHLFPKRPLFNRIMGGK